MQFWRGKRKNYVIVQVSMTHTWNMSGDSHSNGKAKQAHLFFAGDHFILALDEIRKVDDFRISCRSPGTPVQLDGGLGGLESFADHAIRASHGHAFHLVIGECDADDWADDIGDEVAKGFAFFVLGFGIDEVVFQCPVPAWAVPVEFVGDILVLFEFLHQLGKHFSMLRVERSKQVFQRWRGPAVLPRQS